MPPSTHRVRKHGRAARLKARLIGSQANIVLEFMKTYRIGCKSMSAASQVCLLPILLLACTAPTLDAGLSIRIVEDPGSSSTLNSLTYFIASCASTVSYERETILYKAVVRSAVK